MATSKSWSSGFPEVRRQKYFTPDEANRALPLVRQIVSDIITQHDRASRLHAKLEYRMASGLRNDVETELERHVDRLHDLVDEIKAIGCDLKDYRSGLIDFIAKHHGREICLCWRPGEGRVDHWHELHDRFDERKPISALRE